MEEWDLYDRDRAKTGKTIQKGQLMDLHDFRLVVHVCVINQKDQMLIQQRQPFKEGWPNSWDVTASGSALSGESSELAGQRELQEEIGLHVDLSARRPVFTINFEKGFDDFYVVRAEVDVSKLSLQASEVQRVKWATKQEIIQMINDRSFIPYHQSLIEVLFAMTDGLGVHAT